MKKVYIVEVNYAYEGGSIHFVSLSKSKANEIRDIIANGLQGYYQYDDEGNWHKKGGDSITTTEYNLDEFYK